MQSIITKYSNGKVMAKSFTGWVKVNYDAALSSEQNHRAAADKMTAKMNVGKSVKWKIMCSAPSVPGVRGTDNGWCFIIDYVPDVPPMHMSITVKFIGATNTKAARMKVFSWLFPKGFYVGYSPLIGDCSDIQACARFAANEMLERIKYAARDHGFNYELVDYVRTYDGNRLFTLRGV